MPLVLEFTEMDSVFQADKCVHFPLGLVHKLACFPAARIITLAGECWKEDEEDLRPWKGLAGAWFYEKLLLTGIPGSCVSCLHGQLRCQGVGQ